MYPLSAVQLHRRACIICDEDSTDELKVKTVRYFKGLMEVHNKLLGTDAQPLGHSAEQTSRKRAVDQAAEAGRDKRTR